MGRSKQRQFGSSVREFVDCSAFLNLLKTVDCCKQDFVFLLKLVLLFMCFNQHFTFSCFFLKNAARRGTISLWSANFMNNLASTTFFGFNFKHFVPV